jgi:hypothetical protein
MPRTHSAASRTAATATIASLCRSRPGSSLPSSSRLPRASSCLVLLILSALAAVPAAAWDVNSDASPSAFRAFHRRFSADAYPYPRHGAAPLGLIGFEVYAESTYDAGFDEDPLIENALGDDLTGGFLAVGRVGARKGLPAGIDIGLSYGRALGGDVTLLSGEIQYALLKGGVLSPAFSVRVTGNRTVDPGAYELDQYGAELLFSKGFTVLTPYVGAGLVRSEGTLHSTLTSTRLEETDTRGVLYGGITLNLILPRITVEVEKADEVQGAVRVGFGF